MRWILIAVAVALCCCCCCIIVFVCGRRDEDDEDEVRRSKLEEAPEGAQLPESEGVNVEMHESQVGGLVPGANGSRPPSRAAYEGLPVGSKDSKSSRDSSTAELASDTAPLPTVGVGTVEIVCDDVGSVYVDSSFAEDDGDEI